MMSRVSHPLSLRIIAALAISYGALTLIPKVLHVLSWNSESWERVFIDSMITSGPGSLPPLLHISYGLIGSIVWPVSGVDLWKGRTWSRWAMAIWAFTVIHLTYSVYGHAGPLLWKVVAYLVLVYFLFTTKASSFCHATSRRQDA
jgi:hypothetical protein